jgi:hypothetical protein
MEECNLERFSVFEQRMEHPKRGLLHELVFVDRKPDCQLHALDGLEARHGKLEGKSNGEPEGSEQTYRSCRISRKPR